MTESTVQELTPFNFFAGYRSAIRSLGGAIQGPDPKYAFHTEYREFRPGSVIFRVALDNLTISFGDLEIHLNAHVPNSGKNALKANGSKITVDELQQRGGRFEISVYAVKGVTYGLYGFFPDGTDATASGITITVEEVGPTEEGDVPLEAFEPTRFGVDNFAHSQRLVECERAPVFSNPVSQVMTPGQLDEAAFVLIRSELGLSGAGPDIWRKTFILQALKQYGFFESGAKGLCLGDQDTDLAALLADRGSSILFGIDPHREPRLGMVDIPPGAFLSAVEMDYADMAANLRGFDFLWSVGTSNHMGGARQARMFVEQAMRVLRPGGLAIHIIDILSLMKPAPVEDRALPRDLLERDDIIRIAIMLISRSNEVAQMNFDDWVRTTEQTQKTQTVPKVADALPFGLIVRKGP